MAFSAETDARFWFHRRSSGHEQFVSFANFFFSLKKTKLTHEKSYPLCYPGDLY